MYGIDSRQSLTFELFKVLHLGSKNHRSVDQFFFLSGSMAKLQVETIFIVLIPVILALSIS